MMRLNLILFSILLCASLHGAENIKAVGAVSKANIKAIGAVAEANIKAFGAVDNTGSGGPDIAYRSSSHVVGTGTDATPSEPAGAAENDIFLAIFHCASAGTPGLPAGWTELYTGTDPFDGFFDYKVAWIRRGASAPSLTFTTGSSVRREVFIHAISGAITTGSPIDDDDRAQNTDPDPDPPAITTLADNSLIISFGVCWIGSGGTQWVAPTGYTIIGDNTLGNYTYNARKNTLKSPAGTEDPGVFDGSGSGGLGTQTFTIGIKD